MHSLAPDHPDVREFEATVQSVGDRAVVLDRTYFYPESGGQPADRGTIGGVEVADVRERDGEVVHAFAEDPGVERGASVHCVVDDHFRTYCTRAHTASHVLYGAGRRLLSDLGYGGFDIDERKVRVDFATETEIDDETMVELERLTNRTVWDSLPVTWEEVPADAARARDDVAFNTKTEEGVMGEGGSVRLVEIEGWDVGACGGTHVPNTREIGLVEVLDRSNPGEGLTRIEFAVGPHAIDSHASRHRATLEAARELDTGVDRLHEAAASAREEVERLEDERDALVDEVLAARFAALDRLDRDGVTWRVGVVDGFGPNEVGDRLRDAVGESGDVVAVTGEAGATFVAVASRGEVDASEVVRRVTERFGGGGGGSSRFAQGGGLESDPGQVASALRDEAWSPERD